MGLGTDSRLEMGEITPACLTLGQLFSSAFPTSFFLTHMTVHPVVSVSCSEDFNHLFRFGQKVGFGQTSSVIDFITTVVPPARFAKKGYSVRGYGSGTGSQY